MTARDLNIVPFVTGLVFLSQIVLARYLLQKEAVKNDTEQCIEPVRLI